MATTKTHSSGVCLGRDRLVVVRAAIPKFFIVCGLLRAHSKISIRGRGLHPPADERVFGTALRLEIRRVTIIVPRALRPPCYLSSVSSRCSSSLVLASSPAPFRFLSLSDFSRGNNDDTTDRAALPTRPLSCRFFGPANGPWRTPSDGTSTEFFRFLRTTLRCARAPLYSPS